MPTSASRRVWEGKAGHYSLNIGEVGSLSDGRGLTMWRDTTISLDIFNTLTDVGRLQRAFLHFFRDFPCV